MIAILPPLILLVTSIIISLLHFLRPGFKSLWLLAISGSLLSWITTLLFRVLLPFPVFLPLSTSVQRIEFSGLIFDNLGWSFVLALGTVVLAALLTGTSLPEAGATPRPDWFELAGALLYAASLMYALVVADLLSLILAWSLLDLIEISLWRICRRKDVSGSKPGIHLGLRLLSQLVLILGLVKSQVEGSSLQLIPPAIQLTPFLILAAGLRLGIIPPYSSPTNQIPVSKLMDPILRIAPATPALVLLSRVEVGLVEVSLINFFLFSTAFAALFGGFLLIHTESAGAGHTSWVTGLGAFACAAAIWGLPDAAIVWSLAVLYFGTFHVQLASNSIWRRLMLWFSTLALIGIPFSPTWAGFALFTPERRISFVFIFALALLISGSLQKTLSATPQAPAPERWLRPMYDVGLILLPVTWISLNLEGSLRDPRTSLQTLSIESLLTSVILVAMIMLFYVVRFILPIQFLRIIQRGRELLGFNWIYQPVSGFCWGFIRLLAIPQTIFEGQAGLLWIILLLALVVTLFFQGGLRG